jgi:hypothetical protein
VALAVKKREVKFLFQLLHQGTQCGLAYSACLGCSLKVTMLVKRYDVFKLLDVHDGVVFCVQCIFVSQSYIFFH